MAHVLLRMPRPAAISVWDTDMTARIRLRVAAHAEGSEAAALILLLIQTKIDGNAAKLARLAGVQPDEWKAALRVAMQRLVSDPDFNRLFHLVRAAL